jgi:O-antigen/teichoic acid export membrane protein
MKKIQIFISGLFPYITKTWKQHHTNSLIRLSSIITALCLIIGSSILLLYYSKLPPRVPLWFSKPWSEDRLASTPLLFILPLSTLFWYIVNSLLSVFVTKEHLVYTQILFLAGAFVAFFTTVSLSMIIWIIL